MHPTGPGVLERIGAIRGRRLTLGACVALASAATLVGLLAMLVVPVAPPDAAFTARLGAWRALAQAARPAPR